MVAEVDVHGVERRHFGGSRAGETEHARQPIGIEKATLRVAVSLGTDVGGKVFGAPGQSAEPGAGAAIGAGKEQGGCGFGSERDDLDMAVGQPAQRLAHG